MRRHKFTAHQCMLTLKKNPSCLSSNDSEQDGSGVLVGLRLWGDEETQVHTSIDAGWHWRKNLFFSHLMTQSEMVLQFKWDWHKWMRTHKLTPARWHWGKNLVLFSSDDSERDGSGLQVSGTGTVRSASDKGCCALSSASFRRNQRRLRPQLGLYKTACLLAETIQESLYHFERVSFWHFHCPRSSSK